MGEILRVLEPQKVAPKAKSCPKAAKHGEGFARDSDRVHSEGIGNYHNKFKDGAEFGFLQFCRI